MKSYVIGINGKANSGKDTVATMINYIFSVGVTKANYTNFVIMKRSVEVEYADRIIHFADSLKDVLSIIFNIDRKYFDDRKYKDDYYYSLTTKEFVPEKLIKYKDTDYLIITNKLLKLFESNGGLANIIDHGTHSFKFIKLRTLMQYFGTDVCRKYISNNIWIQRGITEMINKSIARRVCIVPDVRFANEASHIMNLKGDTIGFVVSIDRDTKNEDGHESEILLSNVDYEINNNGTLTNLFYKVLEMCQQIVQ